MIEKEGVPESEYTKRHIENHILYFAMVVAVEVFPKAMKSDHPNFSSNEAEKATMLIVFSKAVNVGSQMAGVTDPEMGSIIKQNGMTRLLTTDFNKPSSEVLAVMALTSAAYTMLQTNKSDLMKTIGVLSQLYLIDQKDDHID